MKIPEYIQFILEKMIGAGYEVFIVGGSVRDILMGKEPKDWDLTTNARPEEILKVFPAAKYENDFGTVLIPVGKLSAQGGSALGGEIKNLALDGSKRLEAVEITTYRSEQGYSDRRHPDEVRFEDSLEKDLERRDFTVNALAIGHLAKAKGTGVKQYAVKNLEVPSDWGLIDLFGGQKDIRAGIIRAVGEPEERFREDALRMMRAVRFACQLDFAIEGKTERAIAKLSGSIKFVANERIRDELVKILDSRRAYEGILKLHELKLLNYILPELLSGIGMRQNHHHVFTVWEHLLLSLKYCPSTDWRVKFAALLHDIGKPKARAEKDGAVTFYNHEYISERIARKILARLHFSNDDSEKIAGLVRNHMFYYNVGEVTAASVRRLIKKVGKENLKDLIDMRIGDRLGSGVKKAKPYKLRHLEYMFDRVQNDPVSVKMLKINGDYMIKELGFFPGPEMGAVLDCLLAEVIENPELNTLDFLRQKAVELQKMKLEDLRAKAKELIEEKRQEDDLEIKGKHKVS